jgi:hypothetical protein
MKWIRIPAVFFVTLVVGCAPARLIPPGVYEGRGLKLDASSTIDMTVEIATDSFKIRAHTYPIHGNTDANCDSAEEFYYASGKYAFTRPERRSAPFNVLFRGYYIERHICHHAETEDETVCSTCETKKDSLRFKLGRLRHADRKTEGAYSRKRSVCIQGNCIIFNCRQTGIERYDKVTRPIKLCRNHD